MIKSKLLFLVIFSFTLFKVDAQTNHLPLRPIEEVGSSNYPTYIEKGIPLDLQFLEKSEIDRLFNKSKNELRKHNASSFWFYITTNDIQSDLIYEIYALGSFEINAFKVSFDRTNKNKVEQVNLSKHRNDFYLLEIENNFDFLFINIKKSRSSDFLIKAYTKKSFFLKERRLNAYYGSIAGVFLLLILYHLVLYVKVLDRLYLYYILLILISGLLIVPHSGFIKIGGFLYYDIFFTLFQVSCVIIGVNYLSLYQKYKRITLVILFLILGVNITGIFIPSPLMRYLSHGTSISIYICIILVSFSQKKKSYEPAKWFILPWIALLIAHVFYLFDFDIIFQYRQAIEIGFLTNICLLALAIGNKLNIYKDQKRFAESKELKALSERDRVIQEQNKILEQLINEHNKKILERNTSLAAKQTEIEKNNKVIKAANQRLRIINQELLNKNSEISTQNQELKKHHELLEIIVNKRTKKLLAAKDRAIVADKLKTSFLNNLTHEINTPMNAITGYANLLKDKNTTKERRNEYLVQINKNVDTLLESIDNVVILAKIQARILKLKLKQFKLSGLILNCDKLYKEKLKAHGKNNINFETNRVNIKENTTLYSDYEKLWQVLHRLVDNSIKFTDSGQILVNYELVDKKKDNEYSLFILKVQDTGIGIKKDKLDFILERFSNTDDDKTRLYRGAGIGLAIVKGLVDILQGKIIVHSEANKGTTFQIEIPVLIMKPQNQD